MIDYEKLYKGLDKGLIYTDAKNCIGCNNCIRECPTLEANVVVADPNDQNGTCKIHLDHKECILCGTCLDTCTHNVRCFIDDTEKFFSDLEKGQEISMLIAPSFWLNYPVEYKKVLGYLKSLGIKGFYNVSFGADIGTWANLKYIREHNVPGKISQPCPVIVNYVERHQVELLDYLMPIQSPMMCLAIYLKKYLANTDRLAFLSPCIAKKVEMESSRGQGLVTYNVTFNNFMKHIRDNKIDLNKYPEINDQIQYGLGSLYPSPGGLGENIDFYLGGNGMVVQAEGELHVYEYLSQFKEQEKAFEEMGIVPTLVDVLNCRRGCNYGTATEFRQTSNIFVQIEAQKLRKVKKEAFKGEFFTDADQYLSKLDSIFSSLDLQDFICSYENKEARNHIVSKFDLDITYDNMLKKVDMDKNIDCRACGYMSCEKMATAIALGINRKDNCAEYVKTMVRRFSMTDGLTGAGNRRSFDQLFQSEWLRAIRNKTPLSLLMLDIDEFKQFNDRHGHLNGDVCLKIIANVVTNTVARGSDLVFRWGGEEFAVLLPETTLEGARLVAEKIRKNIEKAPITCDDGIFTVTASIGVSTIIPKQESSMGIASGIDTFFSIMDKALYKAKRMGKNRVETT